MEPEQHLQARRATPHPTPQRASCNATENGTTPTAAH